MKILRSGMKMIASLAAESKRLAEPTEDILVKKSSLW
jgi:hypothetical protein